MTDGGVSKIALMQAPFQKLAGCAVFREGRGVGAMEWVSIVGILGGGDGMGLVVTCEVIAGEANDSTGAASGMMVAIAVGGRGGALCVYIFYYHQPHVIRKRTSGG